MLEGCVCPTSGCPEQFRIALRLPIYGWQITCLIQSTEKLQRMTKKTNDDRSRSEVNRVDKWNQGEVLLSVTKYKSSLDAPQETRHFVSLAGWGYTLLSWLQIGVTIEFRLRLHEETKINEVARRESTRKKRDGLSFSFDSNSKSKWSRESGKPF
jgi:hypothetical protein